MQDTGTQEAPFWQTKLLEDMTESEWESLCDGCGLCCYRKLIDGYGSDERLYFTRIACNQLDLKSGRCKNYTQRFEIEEDCTKLAQQNLKDFVWLPKTCAYRLVYEGQDLPNWHPLISGNINSVKKANIQIKNGIHDKDVIDWFEFVIDEE